MTLSKLPGNVARMTWFEEGGATYYRTDIVRGSITDLAARDGDFSAATQACVLDDSGGNPHPPSVGVFDDPDLPSVGEGFWYLMRADQYVFSCPMGQGTYNFRRGTPSRQVGDRNAEIRLSGHDCPCFFYPTWPETCVVWNP